jgi:hypothetical protein
VGPVKAFELGGVEIMIGVGMFVVVAVMRGPPEGTFLRGCSAEKGEEELKGPACLIAAVGKIAVESASDAELAREEHEGAQGGSFPGDTGPKNSETGHMEKEEENSGK